MHRYNVEFIFCSFIFTLFKMMIQENLNILSFKVRECIKNVPNNNNNNKIEKYIIS